MYQLARERCFAERISAVRLLALSVLDSVYACLFPFGELLELPLVKGFFRQDGLETTIDEETGQLVKEQILDLGIKMKGKVEQKAAADLTATFSEYGLIPSGSQSSAATLRANLNVLKHNCAFFLLQDSYSTGLRSFSEILQDFDKATKETYVKGNPKPINYLSNLDAPHHRAIRVAKKFVEELGIGKLTMNKLQSMGEDFVCTRCDPLLRRKRSWDYLVCSVIKGFIG